MEQDKLTKAKQLYSSVMAERQAKLRHKQQVDTITGLNKTVISSFSQLVKYLEGKTTKTEVVNQLKSISTPDVDKVVQAVSKLDKDILSNKLDLKPLKDELANLGKKLDKLPTSFPEAPEQVDEVTVKNQIDLQPLLKAIGNIKLEPTKVDVKAPNVQVDAPDLKPLQDSLSGIVKAIQAQKYPTTDLTKVEKKLDEANKHLEEISKIRGGGGGGGGNGTPYTDSTGKPVYVETEADGSIPVTINSLTPGTDFDLLTVTNTGATTDELELTLAASPVQTITITYANASVAKVSDDIASVGFA